MFGFQTVARGVAAAASRWSGRVSSYSKPVALNWSFKQSISLLSRSAPIPTGSGLVLLNLRELLEKCKQEADSDIASIGNGNYNLEQVLVLSKASLVDIIGMQSSLTQMLNRMVTALSDMPLP